MVSSQHSVCFVLSNHLDLFFKTVLCNRIRCLQIKIFEWRICAILSSSHVFFCLKIYFIFFNLWYLLVITKYNPKLLYLQKYTVKAKYSMYSSWHQHKLRYMVLVSKDISPNTVILINLNFIGFVSNALTSSNKLMVMLGSVEFENQVLCLCSKF